jgi:signal transduction histidine kinase
MFKGPRVEIGFSVLAGLGVVFLLIVGALLMETGGLVGDVETLLLQPPSPAPSGPVPQRLDALVEHRFGRFLTTVLVGLMTLTVGALVAYLWRNFQVGREAQGAESDAPEPVSLPEEGEGTAPDSLFDALARADVLDDEDGLADEAAALESEALALPDPPIPLNGDGEESAMIADSYNKMVEALQKINDLEKRHSIELAAANQRLEQEIAERERAEREIRHLSRKLMTGIEDAQKNLAQDLHDEFGQTLAALHMGVESLWKSMPEEMVDQKRSIAELIDLIEQLGDKIRSISSDLRPDLLDDLGLVPTIEWYLKEFSERNPGIRTDFQAVGMKKRFPLELELVLYRIFQESLNNVVKHARAGHVGVRLTNSYPKVILLVQDDGVGFSPNQRSAGIGLIGMRERAVSMDGALDIRSLPDKGTTVRVEIPVLKEGDRHEQNPGNDRRRSRGGAGGVA